MEAHLLGEDGLLDAIEQALPLALGGRVGQLDFEA